MVVIEVGKVRVSRRPETWTDLADCGLVWTSVISYFVSYLTHFFFTLLPGLLFILSNDTKNVFLMKLGNWQCWKQKSLGGRILRTCSTLDYWIGWGGRWYRTPYLILNRKYFIWALITLGLLMMVGGLSEAD